MSDFRYHIATLVAVFLALALGILLGASIGQDVINREQIQTVQRADAKIATLTQNMQTTAQQLTQAQLQLSNYQAAVEAILPTIISGQLDGMQVGILNLYGGAPDQVQRTLTLAGAQVAWQADLVGRLQYVNPDKVTQMKQLLGLPATASNADFYTALTNAVVDALYDPNSSNDWLINTLSGDGLLTVRREEQTKTRSKVDAVIVIGGANQPETADQTTVDRTALTRLKEDGAYVVGVENLRVSVSSFPVFQTSHVTSVDNVDQPIGQLSLVAALLGATGNFGEKPTAERLIPPNIATLLAPEATRLPHASTQNTPAHQAEPSAGSAGQ